MDDRIKLRVIIPAVVVLVASILLMPRSPKWNYNFKKGGAWHYENLIAEFDFPILKTQEQLLEEMSKRSAKTDPYYKCSDDVIGKSIKKTSVIKFEDYPNLQNEIADAVIDIYDTGILPDDGVPENSSVMYIQKGKKAYKTPVDDVYTIQEAKVKLLASLAPNYPDINLDSLLQSCGAYDVLMPNLIYDQVLTNLVSDQSGKTISPTSGYVTAGQLIIAQDDIVTAETEQILNSYQKEYEANYVSRGWKSWLGNGLIAILQLLMLFFAIKITGWDSLLYSQYNKLLYLLTVYLIATVVVMIMVRTDTLYLAIPVTLFALFIQSFFDGKLAYLVFLTAMLPLLIFAHEGDTYYSIYLVSGATHILAFKYLSHKWEQFLAALIGFVPAALMLVALYFANIVDSTLWYKMGALFVGFMLCVAGYPLVFIFEKAFNLVTDSRLREYTETGSKMIRELEQKAPGSFQHSLQVMNMADAVARAIHANTTLVRAGALYHDIGKMNNPLCFVENESLLGKDNEQKYHDSLEPL